MMAESSDYIFILSEGHKSLFPQATCRPLTRKIYVAKNGINICLSGQICYLMCTGPFQSNWRSRRILNREPPPEDDCMLHPATPRDQDTYERC